MGKNRKKQPMNTSPPVSPGWYVLSDTGWEQTEVPGLEHATEDTPIKKKWFAFEYLYWLDQPNSIEGVQCNVQTGKRRQLKWFAGLQNQDSCCFGAPPEQFIPTCAPKPSCRPQAQQTPQPSQCFQPQASRPEVPAPCILSPQPKCRVQATKSSQLLPKMGAVLRAHFLEHKLSDWHIESIQRHEPSMESLEDLVVGAQDVDGAAQWAQELQLSGRIETARFVEAWRSATKNLKKGSVESEECDLAAAIEADTVPAAAPSPPTAAPRPSSATDFKGTCSQTSPHPSPSPAAAVPRPPATFPRLHYVDISDDECNEEARRIFRCNWKESMRPRAHAGLEAMEIRELPVESISFTQAKISSIMSGGHSLKKLIAQLNAGKVDPLQEDWLILDVVIMDDKVMSIDNRRLYCLKEHQKVTQHEVLVKVRINGSLQIPQAVGMSGIKRFMSHFDTCNEGRSVRVRGNM